MPAKKKAGASAHTAPADTTAAVDAFIRDLDHPHKPAIEAIRACILGADPSIAEGVKWNAPSFRTGEYFATMHLRQKSGVAVILHLGAKARAVPAGRVAVDDPAKLLKWLAGGRAMVTFDGTADVRAKKAPFERLVREWIAWV